MGRQPLKEAKKLSSNLFLTSGLLNYGLPFASHFKCLSPSSVSPEFLTDFALLLPSHDLPPALGMSRLGSWETVSRHVGSSSPQVWGSAHLLCLIPFLLYLSCFFLPLSHLQSLSSQFLHSGVQVEGLEERKRIILWFEAEFKDPLLRFYLYAE